MEVLLTVLSVSLISTILAIIIVIAEKYLNNYGACEIDINYSLKNIKIEGGDSLLSSLAENKVFIPSACGGKATCGLCKVKVLDGAGDILPTEKPYLSASEINDNIRLSCQIKIKRNLRIVIPNEFFNIKEYKAKVESITDMTHDIKEYRLGLVEPNEIDFKAGQFIQIRTKPYGKIKESVSRAYSISSVPSDKNAVEIIIKLVPGGICTTFMHDYLKEGDEITFNGPYGDFYIREDADNYLFIAGGSGLAPIKSMIFDILEKGIKKNMTFFFGAGSKKDLYYYELFKELEKEHKNFKYVPALAKPDEKDIWDGETGLITEVVSRYVDDVMQKHAYLCGSPGMLDACINILEVKGFTDQNIYFDKF